MTKEDYLELKNKILTYKNISDEKRKEALMQLEMGKEFDFGTGYPSIDQPWLRHYKLGADSKANLIPANKTIWDVMEEKLIEYYDIPALEYFGRLFSKQEFRDLCYTWARTFRAIGVEEDEIVPVYGPFVPDICAMVFGLNMIGACPYFLKLAITPEALEEETRDSKVAVVYDGMWANVASEFSKDKFNTVVVATVTADMPSPKKEIVSFISKIQSRKNKYKIPDDKKYIYADKAREIANYNTGEVKVPFKADRNAIITSSSGTTVSGVIKGVIATNESIIAQVQSGSYSEIPYYPGNRVLNHFPPTAATSLNSLFMLALYNGEIVVLDPRVSEKDFYNQLIKLKPNIALTTGSAWEAFFNRITREMNQGKKFDFSYAIGWTIGGEGTDTNKYIKWNEIMKKCGAKGIYSGYGLSEVFSAVSVEKVDTRYDCSKSIMSVGLPQAGMLCGIYDKNGEELSYNQRGELYIKSKAKMKGYLHKPQLTESVVKNDLIHTGDLSEIDENGFLYVWGRTTDTLKLSDGNEIYLFDISNKLKENDFIDDAMVLEMPTSEYKNGILVHIVWNENVSAEDKEEYISKMNNDLSAFLPQEVVVLGYSEHDTMIPYSPTTLKKDKNKLSKQTVGYVQMIDGKLNKVQFILNDGFKYDVKCDIIDSCKKRILKYNNR